MTCSWNETWDFVATFPWCTDVLSHWNHLPKLQSDRTLCLQSQHATLGTQVDLSSRSRWDWAGQSRGSRHSSYPHFVEEEYCSLSQTNIHFFCMRLYVFLIHRNQRLAGQTFLRGFQDYAIIYQTTKLHSILIYISVRIWERGNSQTSMAKLKIYLCICIWTSLTFNSVLKCISEHHRK